MSNSSGASRVSIPNNVRKTIQNIKEITSNHSEEDIYAMLKECAMDPNETTQRLLHLDTFHEVKRKRDKRKENMNSRVPEDSRLKAGNQGRGSRSGRGSFSLPYTSHDAGGGRSAAFRRENGVEDSREKNFKPSHPVSRDASFYRKMHPVAKSTPVIVNGAVKGPASTPGGGHDGQMSTIPKHDTNAGETKSMSSPPLPKANAQHAPSLDPVLVLSCDSQLPSAVCVIKREVGSQRTATEPIPSEKRESSIQEFTNQIPLNHHVSQGVDESNISSVIEGAIDQSSVAQQKMISDLLVTEGNHPSENSQLSPNPVHDDAVLVNASSEQVTSLSKGLGPAGDSGQNQMGAKLHDCRTEAGSVLVGGTSHSVLPDVSVGEDTTSKLDKLNFSDRQHVIIPNHIQVPDSVKSILSFGSLNASFGAGIKYLNNSGSNKNPNSSADSVNDETAKESSSSCHQDSLSNGEKETQLDDSQAPPSHKQDKVSAAESNISSDAALKDDQLKNGKLPEVGPPYPFVPSNVNYTFGFMPPIVGGPFLQVEGLDPQARLSSPVSGNSSAVSTMPTPTPPLMQSAPAPPSTQSVAGQSSISVPPAPVPLFRQPYPPNYFPYGPYYSPFYIPPALNQFFGHSGFPAQMPTGNVFVPPPAAAAGLKMSPTPYKQGTSAGTQAHVGLPSGYGIYGSTQVGYGPNAAVTAGNSNSNEDLVQSALKENNIYPGQQGEASTVWFPAAGREASSLPVNSFFNLPPPGQHVTVAPQSGHVPFAALYHPIQTIPTPTTGHPLLQQSQSITGSLESAGPPPSNVYQQQPQRQPLNWNGSF